jgi:septal ring factor EnvC (AmiA/AmiB activator)
LIAFDKLSLANTLSAELRKTQEELKDLKKDYEETQELRREEVAKLQDAEAKLEISGKTIETLRKGKMIPWAELVLLKEVLNAIV